MNARIVKPLNTYETFIVISLSLADLGRLPSDDQKLLSSANNNTNIRLREALKILLKAERNQRDNEDKPE